MSICLQGFRLYYRKESIGLDLLTRWRYALKQLVIILLTNHGWFRGTM